MTFLWRISMALGVAATVYCIFRVLGFEPHLGPLSLIAITAVLSAWLLRDGFNTTPVDWQVPGEVAPMRQSGVDRRLETYLRVLDNNRSSAYPDAGLRDRLAEIAEGRLGQAHGIPLHHPDASDLLGPEVFAVLTGGPRRLSGGEIDHVITRIEEL